MQTQHTLEVRNESQVESFTISQVAHLTGVNAKAIRYYESIGLLPRPARFTNRYRCYCQTDVNRLILLRRIRYLGVPLAQAKALLTEVSDTRCIDVQQELSRLVNARLTALDQEIAELHQLRAEIACYQHTLATCHPDEHEVFADCIDMSCIVVSDETLRKEQKLC